MSGVIINSCNQDKLANTVSLMELGPSYTLFVFTLFHNSHYTFRRSVSTLLSSNFRESLDQLIQSYVQRQENSPLDWDLEEAEAVSPASSSPEQEQTQEGNNSTNELYIDQDLRSTVNLPPPPVPPGPLWRSNLHTGGWTRQTIHQPEIVCNSSFYALFH